MKSAINAWVGVLLGDIIGGLTAVIGHLLPFTQRAEPSEAFGGLHQVTRGVRVVHGGASEPVDREDFKGS